MTAVFEHFFKVYVVLVGFVCFAEFVSYNGRKNVEGNASNVVVLPGAISINPLNWKLDDTYAPASENLGSLTANEKGEPEIADIGADAQIVPARGVVVTNANIIKAWYKSSSFMVKE